MFDLFFEWFMRTELLSRVQIYEIFNYNSKPDFSQCKWAETQRKYSLDVLKKLQGLVFPNQGECIDIQHPVVNVPEFHWKRPDEKDGVLGSFTSIAENSVKYLLAKIVNPKHFISLFFNLFLERTIIVYSNEIDVICWIVLALHFLLRPMRWVSGSISCLPADFEDFMNSPNPLIIGTLFKGSPEPDSVYLNFIKTSFNLPNYFKPPFLKDFVHNINHCWGKENTPTEILKFCNDYVSKMEKAIQVCIMTNFTDPVRVNSVFMKELFLGRFDPSEREFCNALLDTQMFRFHVEQECKKKSDQMIISNVPKNVPEASE
ncbi:DENN domain-containing protein [Histomonas meleagridis]|uniref:DENN domain-containing protein n=1 Tax=Histomonas meleagridis TaxID=135588 RepID=UPI003559D5B6|nr:DENN domain-containing protein [Histomonas meleagridis]KAH0807082.1 DENN domain-containing protein [Histomonas meleagridis]